MGRVIEIIAIAVICWGVLFSFFWVVNTAFFCPRYSNAQAAIHIAEAVGLCVIIIFLLDFFIARASQKK